MNYESLQQTLPGLMGRRSPKTLQIEGFRSAAVLIPILKRGDQASLLFTQRASSMQQHGGQISFPGGRVEEGESLVQAALRETAEEVSIPADGIEVLGRLDDFPSVSSYVVAPFVGLIAEPPASIDYDEREVAAVFEAPLQRALDPTKRRIEIWDETKLPPDSPREAILDAHRRLGHLGPEETTYPAYFFDLDPQIGPVWGLTARILEDFLVPLREAE